MEGGTGSGWSSLPDGVLEAVLMLPPYDSRTARKAHLVCRSWCESAFNHRPKLDVFLTTSSPRRLPPSALRLKVAEGLVVNNALVEKVCNDCPGIDRINLFSINSKVSSECVVHLARLTRVRYLNLGGGYINCGGLAGILAALPTLQTLEIASRRTKRMYMLPKELSTCSLGQLNMTNWIVSLRGVEEVKTSREQMRKRLELEAIVTARAAVSDSAYFKLFRV